eukprot:1241531-Prymnesium_polylepis.1
MRQSSLTAAIWPARTWAKLSSDSRCGRPPRRGERARSARQRWRWRRCGWAGGRRAGWVVGDDARAC